MVFAEVVEVGERFIANKKAEASPTALFIVNITNAPSLSVRTWK
jgi:hypothetical protein